MKRFRALFAVAVLCLGAIGVYVFLNLQQLGLILPSLQELEHRADVAAGQTGDKSLPKWRDFLDRSRKFAEENPNMLEIWLLRGAGALVVGDQEAGKEAGEHLVILNKSADPAAAKLIKVLWAKRWIPTSRLNRDDAIAIFNDVVKADAIPAGHYYNIQSINDHAIHFSGNNEEYEHVYCSIQNLEIQVKDTSKTPPYAFEITTHPEWIRFRHEESNYDNSMARLSSMDGLRGEFDIELKDRIATQLAAELLAHIMDLARG